MYTWGYIKESTLSKLNLSEEEANQQNFLSHFPYYANEAMTQICSAVKANEKYYEIEVFPDEEKYEKEKYHRNDIVTLPYDFIAFSDAPVMLKRKYYVYDKIMCNPFFVETDDESLEYYGYNQVICHNTGVYRIPYKARWFFFTKDLSNSEIITAPDDVCEAIACYIAAQCYKVDDEAKSAVYRNEFEVFLARMDDSSFRAQRTFHIGGGW